MSHKHSTKETLNGNIIKKAILIVFVSLVLSDYAIAGTLCFVAQENGLVILEEGDCKSRRPCCSTFKIAISLMGFNEGILVSETTPELHFKPGYYDLLDSWKQPQSPATWMKNSCVWYSQVLTQEIGMKKFADYVSGFNYGNCDVSGDKGKDNGLTNCWLSSSLQISGFEQVDFLMRLLDQNLPVSSRAMEMTRKLLYLEEIGDGWKLYGKTGSGYELNIDGSRNMERPIGWFIGWINKDDREVLFAHFVEDAARREAFPGMSARITATEKLAILVKNQ